MRAQSFITCPRCLKVRHALYYQLLNPEDYENAVRGGACAFCYGELKVLDRAVQRVRRIRGRLDHTEKQFRNRLRSNVRNAQIKMATPAWANKREIARVFRDAKQQTEFTGIAHQVDHIIPVRSKVVCGLHIPANLRVVPAKINARKSNKLPAHNA